MGTSQEHMVNIVKNVHTDKTNRKSKEKHIKKRIPSGHCRLILWELSLNVTVWKGLLVMINLERIIIKSAATLGSTELYSEFQIIA